MQVDLALLLDTEGTKPLTDISSPPSSVALASGPRGGWHDDEIALFANANFTSVKLGPRVLRAETAPVVALALMQWLWGDWNR